ncbi:MAG: ABC transporter substrate-binding protein [Bacillota bacterium]
MNKMKSKLTLVILLLTIFALPGLVAAEKGPVADKIYFDVRMQQEIGIQDTAAGTTDVFLESLDGPQIFGLADDTLDSLDIYSVPGSYWSLSMNPIPNKAPYTWEVDGEEEFNPFAIREIRYEMNWLMNRQYVIDEILDGAGGPMYTMAIPGQPGTYRYNLLANKHGMTPEGDQEKAFRNIEAAMEKAAKLPENEGRLVRGEDYWLFDDKPVTINFLIRVDDPEGRVRLGNYFADKLEGAGFKVERLLWDRSRCTEEWLYGDPADMVWHIYTEGWLAGATRRYWEHIVAQMHAPWYGFMAGGFAEGPEWKYQHEELDQISQKAYRGEVLTEEEYWDTAIEGLDIGINEAVRIYVAYTDSFFVSNADRIEERMIYGLGDGLNRYSLTTTPTVDGTLNVTQYSARGDLFMSAWNPVGPDGLTDAYSQNIADLLRDRAAFESPATGSFVWDRGVLLDYKSDVDFVDEELAGKIEVPADALVYDPYENEWVEIGAGENSFSYGKYAFKSSKYHHGEAMDIVDYLYAEAFVEQWRTKTHEGDPYYNAQYEAAQSGMTNVARVWDFENETVESYYNFNFPADKTRAAVRGIPDWTVSASQPSVGVVWEVVEALQRMVVDGPRVSDTNWGFSPGAGVEETDVLRSPTCIKDVRAELVAMIEERHVPVYIKDFITADEAIKRYQAAIDFIDEYGHAYIANGPYYVSDFDTSANYAELSAFRDETYPHEPGYWREVFEGERLVIEDFNVPIMAEKGEEISLRVDVDKVLYPDDTSEPAPEGDVKVMLITDDEEIEFEAEYVGLGMFLAKIPGEYTKDLETGKSYTVLAVAELGDSIPSTITEFIVVY